MWRFRWSHKRSERRRIRGVFDCVSTMERIQARIGVLHAEVQRLTKGEPSAEAAIRAEFIAHRCERLIDHAHRVKDIQAAWAARA